MIGERIREERERLKFSQSQLATICGITKRSVFSYEDNETSPKTDFLVLFGAVGADTHYILTGKRDTSKKGVQLLTDAFFDAHESIQLAICKLLDIDQSKLLDDDASKYGSINIKNSTIDNIVQGNNNKIKQGE